MILKNLFEYYQLSKKNIYMCVSSAPHYNHAQLKVNYKSEQHVFIKFWVGITFLFINVI